MNDHDAANASRWDGRPGFYEVWYTTLNDPKSGGAFWIRTTLLSPERGEPTASLWFMSFEPRLALKETFPIAELRRESSPFRVALAGATLDGARLQGAVKGARWDLTLTSRMPSLHPAPPIARALKLARSSVIATHPCAEFTGTIEAGGRTFVLDRAPGQQSHTWGTRYARWWTWAHCNAFDGRPDVVLEAVSGKAGGLTPEFTIILARVGAREIRLNSAWRALRNRSSFEPGRWSASGGDVRFEVKAPRTDFIGVTYTSPRGTPVPCYNTEVASCELRVGGETFVSRRTAHFEFAGKHQAGFPMDLPGETTETRR